MLNQRLRIINDPLPRLCSNLDKHEVRGFYPMADLLHPPWYKPLRVIAEAAFFIEII
jgi:hypothetical protein